MRMDFSADLRSSSRLESFSWPSVNSTTSLSSEYDHAPARSMHLAMRYISAFPGSPPRSSSRRSLWYSTAVMSWVSVTFFGVNFLRL